MEKNGDQSLESDTDVHQIVVDETHDQNKIYCFGDSSSIL